MKRSRFVLLALCAMVLGLASFSSTAAQAEPNAEWLFAELLKDGTLHLIPFLDAFLGFENDKPPYVLHSKIAGVTVLFECSSVSAVNVQLKATGSVGSGAKAKYSECITKLNGATSAACVPKAGGTETGIINTNALHALLTLHILKDQFGNEIGKDHLIQILPDSGETFATIEMGKECAIGTKVPVIGKLYLEDCLKDLLKHLLKHLFEAGPLTELWVISKTAEHVSTILGSVWAKLIGVGHEGLHWSGET